MPSSVLWEYQISTQSNKVKVCVIVQLQNPQCTVSTCSAGWLADSAVGQQVYLLTSLTAIPRAENMRTVTMNLCVASLRLGLWSLPCSCHCSVNGATAKTQRCRDSTDKMRVDSASSWMMTRIIDFSGAALVLSCTTCIWRPKACFFSYLLVSKENLFGDWS